MNEAEMYRAAAHILRRDGWRQPGGPPGTGTCIGLALSDVCPDGAFLWARNSDLPCIHELVGDSLAEFNDKRGMTADDAIAALEIAADVYDARVQSPVVGASV